MSAASNYFLPPSGCPKIFPPKLPSPDRERPIVSDEICGNIFQEGNGEFVEYWRTYDLENMPTGSVSVVNNSDSVLIARADTDGDGIADVTLFTITERGQTKSATLGRFAKLEIACLANGNSWGSGKYCISIHY